jgi:hypothetical protein
VIRLEAARQAVFVVNKAFARSLRILWILHERSRVSAASDA